MSYIRHIQQRNDYTCAPAVVAMITGLDLGLATHILNPTPKRGTPHKRLIAVLKSHGVRCGDRFVSMRGKQLPGVAVVRISGRKNELGHVVLKVGDVWHDPTLPGSFAHNDRISEDRTWFDGRRITSALVIDALP